MFSLSFAAVKENLGWEGWEVEAGFVGSGLVGVLSSLVIRRFILFPSMVSSSQVFRRHHKGEVVAIRGISVLRIYAW
jgi:hypothetical protein